MSNGVTFKELASHPEYRQAYKRYCQSEAQKWLEVAYKLCDGSEENLPKYSYAMKRYNDFRAKAEREIRQ